jgi:hypothetical protein
MILGAGLGFWTTFSFFPRPVFTHQLLVGVGPYDIPHCRTEQSGLCTVVGVPAGCKIRFCRAGAKLEEHSKDTGRGTN